MSEYGRKLKVKRLAVLVVAVVVVAGGLAALHQFQERRQAGGLLTRADAAAADQDWESAADLYRNYLNFRPNDVPAVAGYADVLAELAEAKPGYGERMVAVTEQLVRLDPTRLDAREKLAGIYVEAGRYPNAREHLAYLLNPDEGGRQADADLLELAAACEARDGRNFAGAVAYLERAVATGTASTDAYLQLALALHNEITTDEARAKAVRVTDGLIAARPDDIEARLARAKFRVQTDDPTKAREDIEYAATLPGGAANPDVILARAELAVWTKNFAEAKSVLRSGTKTAPNDLRIRLRLADVLQRLNEVDEAKKVLPRPRKRTPCRT